jgi:hypothetical protein
MQMTGTGTTFPSTPGPKEFLKRQCPEQWVQVYKIFVLLEVMEYF